MNGFTEDFLISDNVAEDQEAREILAEAAEYIAEHGWNQGGYVDKETGGVCALGAIWSARDGVLFTKTYATDPETGRYQDSQYLKEIRACNSALFLLTQHLGSTHIPSWNDMPERTAEDVILALKGAAHQ